MIFRQTNQGVQEPIEHVFIEVANGYLGAVSELISNRQGRFLDLRYGEDNSIYAEYHALFVIHAKRMCTKAPICHACPLLDLCPKGKMETGLTVSMVN